MITVYAKKDKVLELRGLSTDTKPTDVGNGSIYICIDTGDMYMFDSANKEWYQI